MRRKVAEWEEARKLRSEGLSVRRIAARLGVSVSSVSVWVRDVPLSREQRAALEVPRRKAYRKLRPAPSDAQVAHERSHSKQCGLCGHVKALSDFSRDGVGHQHWCKSCFSGYFAARGRVHRTQSGRARAQRRLEARLYLANVMHLLACSDCGLADAIVLELYDVGHKRGEVSRLVAQGASIAEIAQEIEQCEPVCVNCHADAPPLEDQTTCEAGTTGRAEPQDHPARS